MDLVIMAAGMGSRFGGLKQIEPMDEEGNFILDYSIFDGIRCGFDRVVFIIKEENYDIFRQTVGKRVEKRIKVEYVFQKLDDIPSGYSLPADRVKPWGTGHAILVCKEKVNGDFVIINADDFYGYDAFRTASQFIRDKKRGALPSYALIGYKAGNTLSQNGSAKRGVCEIENGRVKHIEESSIERVEDRIIARPLEGGLSREISPQTIVSMNMWCLDESVFEGLEREFVAFLDKNLKQNPLKCEYLIPSVISDLADRGEAEIFLKETSAVWHGVTYREDKEGVVSALKKYKDEGVYPQRLWE